MKPRAHAELIKLWADGAQIQYRSPQTDGWVDCDDPAFVADYEYRVKPAREYVKTKLHEGELSKLYAQGEDFIEVLNNVANGALRHAIDNGQVVTREEFDRAIGDRDARDYKIAKSLQAYFANMFAPMTLNRTFAEAIDIKEVLDRVKA